MNQLKDLIKENDLSLTVGKIVVESGGQVFWKVYQSAVALSLILGEVVELVFNDQRYEVDPSAVCRLVENFGDLNYNEVDGLILAAEDIRDRREMTSGGKKKRGGQ